jgi:hypothetical protein
MITMPVVPAYKPDAKLAALIRAAIEANKAKALSRAVTAARSVA